MILLMYKEATLLTNLGTEVLPSTIDSLLQEFQDVVVKYMPTKLPPLQGIKHQIDLVPGASLPNKPLIELTQKKQKSCSGK